MDQVIVCADCKQEFVFTERDQEFYLANEFTPPKRCKPCREQRKRERGMQPRR